MPLIHDVKNVMTIECVGFQCNCCKKQYGKEDFIEFDEAMHWEHVGGYGSIFGDGIRVEVTLCQHCVKQILSDFIVVSQEETE